MAGQTVDPRYDGSIAAIESQSKKSPLQGGEGGVITAYAYDDQSRLSQTHTAKDQAGSWSGEAGAFDMAATYDDNGNIQTLDRKSEGTVIDDLDYNYDDDSKSVAGRQ